jgi:hypothetical protein
VPEFLWLTSLFSYASQKMMKVAIDGFYLTGRESYDPVWKDYCERHEPFGAVVRLTSPTLFAFIRIFRFFGPMNPATNNRGDNLDAVVRLRVNVARRKKDLASC